MSGDGNEILSGVNLTDEQVSYGAGYELLCCGSAHPHDGVGWISAAEIIYDLTQEPGRVVRNEITFDLNDEEIKLNLLDGGFQINRRDAGSPIVGRKGLELLMKWKGYDFDQAVEYIVDNYSADHAIRMIEDFGNMKARAVAEREARAGAADG